MGGKQKLQSLLERLARASQIFRTSASWLLAWPGYQTGNPSPGTLTFFWASKGRRKAATSYSTAPGEA